MGAVDIVIFVGATLFAVGGVLKTVKPKIRILGSFPPCGISMAILGMGLAPKAWGL